MRSPLISDPGREIFGSKEVYMADDDPSRIERLMNEIETLKQAIQFTELEHQRRMLRGQLAVIGYLRTQLVPVDKDRILAQVHLRHGIILRALHRLVQDGRVTRTGSGQRGDGYRYRVAGTPDGDERGNGAPNRWTTVQKRRNPIFGKREGITAAERSKSSYV
jgi:hypothetical protein